LLGVVYVCGLGVESDYVEAMNWFKKATAQGDKKAHECIERLQKLMND